jgi:hypothetical protein
MQYARAITAAVPVNTPDTVGWIASHVNRPSWISLVGGDGLTTP